MEEIIKKKLDEMVAKLNAIEKVVDTQSSIINESMDSQNNTIAQLGADLVKMRDNVQVMLTRISDIEDKTGPRKQ